VHPFKNHVSWGQALNFAAYAGMLGADTAYYFNPFEYDKKNVRNLKMYMQ